jgi:hypothetical protein
VVLTSEATIYGVRRTDSLRYAVGYPTIANVNVYSEVTNGGITGYFFPGTITVNVGAVVAWHNNLPNGLPIDVVFEAPALAQREDSTDFAHSMLNFLCTDAGCHRRAIPNESGGNIAPFTNDSVCVGGHFSDVSSGQPCSDGRWYDFSRARRFPTAGDYPYHSTLYGTNGIIHVVPNP